MKTNVFKNSILSVIAVSLLSAPVWAEEGQGEKKSKRDLILSVLDQSKPNEYVPAAFFLHFENKLGDQAVQDHINFFKATNMDLVKVQYEIVVPRLAINSPEDWSKVPVYGPEFFEPQIAVIEKLSKALKDEALILPTVYSPIALLHQTVGDNYVELIKANPEAARPALENITKSIENYLRAARKRGADGFYVSSQGGDTRTFGNTPIFTEIIRPYDKRVSEIANEIAPINILHICDYGSSYVDINSYTDYPASIINPPIHLENGSVDLKNVQTAFNRPVFGGLDRLGVLTQGTLEEAKAEVDKVLQNASPNFILGADCTVPSDTDYEKLRAIIEYAHNWRANHKD